MMISPTMMRMKARIKISQQLNSPLTNCINTILSLHEEIFCLSRDTCTFSHHLERTLVCQDDVKSSQKLYSKILVQHFQSIWSLVENLDKIYWKTVRNVCNKSNKYNNSLKIRLISISTLLCYILYNILLLFSQFEGSLLQIWYSLLTVQNGSLIMNRA